MTSWAEPGKARPSLRMLMADAEAAWRRRAGAQLAIGGCGYGDQATVIHHLAALSDVRPETLVLLSAVCHRGDHPACEHHSRPDAPHGCECACHLGGAA